MDAELVRSPFFFSDERVPVLKQGPARKIFDAGSLPGGPFYVNDHTLIRDDAGRWHLYGIFNHEPFNSEIERSFVHARSEGPELAELKFLGTVLQQDVARGENHVWAPHVVRDADGSYVMAYHAGHADNDNSHMSIARSRDLEHWERISAPAFSDICVARDPMLLKLGSSWLMYYTRCNDTKEHESGVAYRVSSDLVHWSEPRMALVLKGQTLFNSGYTESPFVFERGGWFYLSFTSYPIEWVATRVFRSRSPFQFDGPEIARLVAHAGEWIAPEGDFEASELLLTHAGPGQGGVYVSPVEFR